MTPFKFPGSNKVFTKPEGWTDDQCSDLHTYVGKDDDGVPYILSAWMPSEADKEAVAAGRPVMLKITGTGMPPVLLYTHDADYKPNPL